jgi:hypothetical protein
VAPLLTGEEKVMKYLLVAIGCGIIIIVATACASAATIQLHHDPSIAAHGLIPQDGFNLTFDSETDLEWLDVSLTTNLSYNQVRSQFDSGGQYEGFRHAKWQEVTAFWEHAGIFPVPTVVPHGDPIVIDGGAASATLELIMALGTTSPGPWVHGYIDDFGILNPTASPLVGSAEIHPDALGQDLSLGIVGNFFGPDEPASNIGSWLIRDAQPVPEPDGSIVGHSLRSYTIAVILSRNRSRRRNR